MIRKLPKTIAQVTGIVLVSILSLQSVHANNYISDSVITSKIKSKAAMDKTLSALNVSVETNDGIVKLDGTVDSDTEASTYVEIAQSTSGVRDVDTESLSVKRSRTPISDTYITAKVKGTFVQQNLFGRAPHVNPTTIHVETNNSIVYLSGSVKSRSIAQKAVSLAKHVDGVKEVKYRFNYQT